MTTLTKFTHSCVRFDDGDRTLVIDPGVFSEVDAALDGTDAVLITHEHPDHVNADALRAAAKANPRLRVWAPPNFAASLELGEQVVTVAPGETFQAGGFDVEVFGGQHALIHPTVPLVQNNCYLVDGAVYHPGDSFVVPPKQPRVLLLPIAAPWSKTAEVVDFMVSVRAPRALPIHEVVLSEPGLRLVEGHVTRIGAEHGVEYTPVDAGSTLSV
jgi:L-ascorbate metabolism protein UlaG (beta-lactamase superfamily)